MNTRRISLRTVVLGACSVVLGLTFVLGAVSLRCSRMALDTRTSMAGEIGAVRSLEQLAGLSQELRALHVLAHDAPTEAERLGYFAETQAARIAFVALWNAYARTVSDPREQLLAHRMRDAWQHFPSEAIIQDKFHIGPGAFTSSVNAVLDDRRARTDQAIAATARLGLLARDLVVALLPVIALLVLGIAWGTLRGASRPVAVLAEVMRRLATRALHTEVPYINRRDAIGAMAAAVQMVKYSLSQEAALARQQQATQIFLDTILEHVPAPIFVKNAHDLSYVHVNLAAEAFTGVGRERLLGRSNRDWMSLDSAAFVLTRDTAALAARSGIVSHDEPVESVTLGQRVATVTRVAIPGPDGTPQYLLVMLEDVTERRQAERRIAYLAHNDTLTDLPNRDSFALLLEEAITTARRDGRSIAVLGLDLDRFKDVNDTLGHAAGDALLRSVASRFRACLREGDILARIGGDEFAAIQCNVEDPRDAENLARRLIEAARRPFAIDGRQVLVGLSVGISLGPPAIELDELLKQVDMALYEAKEAGRGCLRFFNPDMEERQKQSRALETDLRAAMDAGELTLHYQPQVDLHSRAILGAEALMRWTHPARGQVPPDQFIPVSEDIGEIGLLGDWLLRTACAEAMTWHGSPHVAVNVSPVQFALPGFVESVQQALERSGLDPARLELEVTEGILLRDTAYNLLVFAALRALGVMLVLDDFGSGYASLGYLQKFRFDKIKIDRGFISGLCDDPAASAIVRSTVGLSQSLGMRTNAEGVETDAEAALLRSFGCTEAQGYYFFRPMPAAEMRALTHDAADAKTAGAA